MQNSTSLMVRRAIRFALAATATTLSSHAAFAQTAPADPVLQDVVVTGSRIQQSPNDVSISPVTSVTAIDIQKTGLVRAEDLLNSLPQVVAENSSGQSISSNGTATVSLRGLGSARTLVLVDGFRMSPGAGLGTSSVADINQLPAGLVERVDVLTGGASSVYGADAVAGVVNFVLNTHFEGVKVDVDYGINQHKNNNEFLLDLLAQRNNPAPEGTVRAGANKNVSIVAGSNFADGKGNATVYFGYLKSEPAVGNQYDYAGCTLNTPGSITAIKAGKQVACGGSSSSATGRFLDLGLTPAGNTSTTIADATVNPAGGIRGYKGSRDSYNYGGISYLQRASERYTAGAFLNYDVNEHTNVYSEFMYARNSSTAQYGPSGLFAFGQLNLHCSNLNPLIPADFASTICSPSAIAANEAQWGGTNGDITLLAARRSVESGPRLDNYYSNSFREVLGAKGKLNDAWSYDIHGQVGITTFQDVEGGFLGAQQVLRALDVVPNPATGGVAGVAAGAPVCNSALNGSDTACVPWNIWNPGGVTPDQLKYLTVQSTYSTKSLEYIASASATGDLGKYGWKVPTAASGVIVNVGAEYRQEHFDFDPDYIFANGFASGGNGAFSAIHGGFHVAEVFGEFRLPLVDDKPGIYVLSADGGYRYSTYTSGFSTNTYKFGVEYAPISDVRFRGSYNRAVRAPSIGDLYSPSVVGSGGVADPCWGSTPQYTLQQCLNTGVTAGQYGKILPNTAAQINTSSGGNPNLTPEVADTFSFGVVMQPKALPGLVVSIDYYDIKIKNTIASLSSDTIIANCANTGQQDLCSLIHRDPQTGSLWFNNNDYVAATEQNIGTVQTKGIDLASHYTLSLGSMGKLGLSLNGTHVQALTTQPLPTGGSFDCAGLYGSTCGSPTPKWRHVFTSTWATPWKGLDVTARWRYIGSVDQDSTDGNPALAKPYFPPGAHYQAWNYIDLSASMPVATGVTLRLGVNNISDRLPPLAYNGNYSNCPNLTCNDNTWVGTYDTMGRYMYAHISAQF